MASATHTPTDTTEQAARLRLAVTRLARRLRQQGGTELGPASLAALASIERLGPLTPSALAEIERVQRPTAARILARLEEEALIDRAPDPTDGRCSLISISAEGRRTLKRVRSRKNAYLATRLRELPADDVATLERATEILERVLDQDPA